MSISAVYVPEDKIGEGLLVELEGEAATTAQLQSDRANGKPDPELSKLTGIPTEISSEAAKLSTMSRGDNSPPWHAGGGRNSGGCSLAFGTWNSAGHMRILSAWHCGYNWSTVYDGTGDPIGPAVAADKDYDAQLIDPTSTVGGYGRMYTGTWYSSSTIAVKGAAWNNVNDYVCTSGARSGQHCNLRVISTTQSGFSGLPGPFVRAQASSHSTCAVVGGDSGGPVYDPTSTGDAIAKGHISGGVHVQDSIMTDCNPVRNGPIGPNDGGFAILYKQLPNVLNRFSLTMAVQ